MTTPFPLRSPRDLLDKAKREFELLEACAEGHYGDPNETAIADLTINTAWSLWHVTDWIGNNDDSAVMRVVPDRIKKAGRERTEAFQAQLRSESPDLRICWALALRFKHFELWPESGARNVLADSAAHNASTPDMSAQGQVGAVGPSSRTLHPKV